MASEYTSLNSITAIYGEEGKDNGVTVDFGDISYGKESSDIINMRPIMTVTFPKDLQGDELVIAIAHEGSHIMDWLKYANALKSVALYDSNAGSVINDPSINLTDYSAEAKAYTFSAIAAAALGRGTLRYPPYTIMRNGRVIHSVLNAYLLKILPNPWHRFSDR